MSGCAVDGTFREAPGSPQAIRTEITALLPSSVADRAGWAQDIQRAFTALRLDATPANVCAVLAITEQESSFRADPSVPNLPALARAEIFRRAERAGVPQLAVRMALQLQSPTGKTYDERLDAVRTERELSLIFEDFTGIVPLGQRLLADYNPVRTGGPMQVSIAFAEQFARERGYPYETDDTIRHEVFTRRGGLYFGIAHLLDYPAAYGQMIYRFADFNAGHYASRNAAFQQAVSVASGKALDLDGDLLLNASNPHAPPGETEAAVLSLAPALAMSVAAIRRELQRGDSADFDRSPLQAKVFALAEQQSGRHLPRAVVPKIELKSPKITRKLTTEWFARRVDERHQRCLARSPDAATRVF
ncbi:MAG: DUF1615 domain-containing protein [Burkholderiales bacterium]|nr:MAG: DUF1615 domain-containing protein [Burkholderiales bacterium]